VSLGFAAVNSCENSIVRPGRRQFVLYAAAIQYDCRNNSPHSKFYLANNPSAEVGEESIMGTTNRSLAIGVAAAISLGSAFALGATSPSQAAPLSINALALKEAAPENVIDARYRGYRGYRGSHAFAGLALGVVGAVIAHQAYRHHYHQPYGYYHQPYGYYYGAPSCIRRHGLVYCR
jgi:hypothetical protein